MNVPTRPLAGSSVSIIQILNQVQDDSESRPGVPALPDAQVWDQDVTLWIVIQVQDDNSSSE